MSAARVLILLLVVLLLWLGGAPPALAQFVVPEGSDFHNGSTLPLQAAPEAELLLARLEHAVAVADPDEVAFVLRALRQRPGTDLVPFGPRTHVPALERAARLVAALGSEAVQARVAREQGGALAAALGERDLAALLDLASRGASLPGADQACLAAARLLFEQGRWWEAACLAERAGTSPGAARLAEVARGRLPAPPEPPRMGDWSLTSVLSGPLDPAEDVGLPLVLDGRDDELLLLDAVLLAGRRFEQGVLVRSFPDVFWSVLALEEEERHFASNPAPRRQSAVRSGARFVLPFNVSTERGYRSPRAPRDARLLAFDLGELPSVAWIGRASDQPGSDAFGPPALSGPRLFVQLFRSGMETEVALASFELDTGRRLFEVPLVRGTQVRRFASRQALLDIDELDKRAREGAVAVGRDGVVHACTGFGAVAAVDGVTGQLRHVFRYDRLFPLEKEVYDPAFLFDTGGWNDEPVRLWEGRVVVAPSDSRYLYMLAERPGPGGHVILDDPIERLDRVDVVGLRPDPAGRPSPAVLATRWRDNLTSLVLLGPDGHVLAVGPPLPPGERQEGRPLLVDDLVLLPTGRGVRLFDARDLSRPPGLLPIPADLPPARALHVLRSGLAALCPDEGAERLHVVLWREDG